jgi:hypothetical protein
MTAPATTAAMQHHDDLERLRNHDVDLDAMLEGRDPASIDAIYGDAAFLLWRLLANGRRDLWQAAIRRSAEMHAADLLEVHR